MVVVGTTSATTPPWRLAIRSARTCAGTSPIANKASAMDASAVEAFRSAAKRTNRPPENASTAQNKNYPGAIRAQSTRYCPVDDTIGRCSQGFSLRGRRASRVRRAAWRRSGFAPHYPDRFLARTLSVCCCTILGACVSTRAVVCRSGPSRPLSSCGSC